MAFLAITTAPTNILFASLADVKADLGITDSANDAVLLRMIKQTSAEMVTAACRREQSLGNPFARAEYTEKASGSGDQILQLARYPIVEIDTVLLDGVTPVTDYEVYSADAGQLWREAGWDMDDAPEWMLTARRSGRRGPALYTVTYTAGYLMWDEAGAAVGVNLPHDIQSVCIEFAKEKYYARARDKELRSRTVGEVSESYGGASAAGGIGSRGGGSGAGMIQGVPSELWARMTPWREAG